MGDMADDFRALRMITKSARKTTKRQNMVAINRLERAGAVMVQRFNGSLHLRLTNPLTRATIDFYPSTNRIRTPDGRGRIGDLAEALDRIGIPKEARNA